MSSSNVSSKIGNNIRVNGNGEIIKKTGNDETMIKFNDIKGVDVSNAIKLHGQQWMDEFNGIYIDIALPYADMIIDYENRIFADHVGKVFQDSEKFNEDWLIGCLHNTAEYIARRVLADTNGTYMAINSPMHIPYISIAKQTIADLLHIRRYNETNGTNYPMIISSYYYIERLKDNGEAKHNSEMAEDLYRCGREFASLSDGDWISCLRVIRALSRFEGQVNRATQVRPEQDYYRLAYDGIMFYCPQHLIDQSREERK